MAIWQFGFYLVPKKGLLGKYKNIPSVLDEYKSRDNSSDFDEDKEFPNYWYGVDVPNHLKERISDRLNLLKSWSEEAEMFGSDDSTRIEIWNDDFRFTIDDCDIRSDRPRKSKIVNRFRALKRANGKNIIGVIKKNLSCGRPGSHARLTAAWKPPLLKRKFLED